VAALLPSLPWYESASTVGVYSDLRNELPTGDVIRALIEDGKGVYLPRCADGDDGADGPKMDFVRCFEAGRDDRSEWRRGKYGIMEPEGAASDDDIDLLIVPGVAFDPVTFRRLGQGKGYYDRWIQGRRAGGGDGGPKVGKVVGVCLDCQVVEGVPFEEHDVVMDGLIWPGGGVQVRKTVDSPQS